MGKGEGPIITSFCKKWSSKSQVLEVPAIAWMDPGRCRGAPMEEESRGSRANMVGGSPGLYGERKLHFLECILEK